MNVNPHLSLRVGIGFVNNANMAFAYSEGLLKCGVSVTCFLIGRHPFGYKAPIGVNVQRCDSINEAHEAILNANLDVFLCLAGTGGTPQQLESFYLKLKKQEVKLVSIHLGSDSRLSCISDTIYYLKSISPCDFSPLARLMADDVELRASYVGISDAYSDLVIDNPFSWHLHKRPFLNFHYIGIPLSSNNTELACRSRLVGMTDKNSWRKPSLILGHIPSNPLSKGTNEIRRVFSRIMDCSDSRIMQYIPTRRLVNSQVLDRLSKIDIYIDQIYSDMPISVSSLEAMSLGKPTIILGEYLQHSSAWSLGINSYSSITGRPNQLEDILLYLIRELPNEGFRLELARRMNSWLDYYSSLKTGSRLSTLLLRLVNGDLDIATLPDDLPWIDPLLSSITEVSFHPANLFFRLASQGFFGQSVDRLLNIGHQRAAFALVSLINKFS